MLLTALLCRGVGQGSRLPDASEQHEITTGTVAGGGVPLMAASAVDRQDFIFQTFGGNAIRTPIRTFARLGEQDSNVSWTDSTRFPVGTSHVRMGESSAFHRRAQERNF